MVLSLRLCIILVITLSLSQFQFVGAHDYDHHHYDHHVSSAFLTTEDFIRNAGFEGKTYEVITEDGYILQITRILSSGTGHKKPFLMIPGIGQSSDGFVLNANSLSFVMARANYDVWLGNLRGEDVYGIKNIYYSNDSPEFWNYSFHENGLYDLPAIIDFVLSVTGHSKLIYMGHSKGSTSSFVLLSLRPEYNDKIALAVQYAPKMVSINPKSVSSASNAAEYRRGITEKMLTERGIYYFSALTNSERLSKFRKCNEMSILRSSCWWELGLDKGYDDAVVRNTTYSGTVFSHIDGVRSAKDLIHAAQCTQRGQFIFFDYGPEKNVEVYNSTEPPLYPLKNIQVPMFLANAANDWVVTPQSFEYIVRHLKNPFVVYNVPSQTWSHVSYQLATDPNILFEPTLQFIEQLKL